MANRFRNSLNKYLLKSLFVEHEVTPGLAIYTLRDYDLPGYPSLYLRYMAATDLLEHSFAQESMEGWEHWALLCESPWFQPYLSRWRQELSLHVRGAALGRIIADSKSGSKTSPASNRFLVEAGWAPKNTKGRPTKASIKAEAQRQAIQAKEVEDDLARVKGVPN